MTQHAHDTVVAGCFRCDLSSDEPLHHPDQTGLIGSQLEQPSPESLVRVAELRRKRGLADYDDRRPA